MRKFAEELDGAFASDACKQEFSDREKTQATIECGAKAKLEASIASLSKGADLDSCALGDIEFLDPSKGCLNKKLAGAADHQAKLAGHHMKKSWR